MKQEIERKFLIDAKKLPKLSRPRKVIQGYLSQNPEVRARITDKKAHLTIKTLGELTRDEFEYEIPLKDAKKLLELTNLTVEKLRYFLTLNGFCWVIDFFQGENSPLVTAEVELPHEDSKFKKPLWVGKEVTFDARFNNRSLAKSPFCNWKDSVSH
ncbi:MAG: hypothetical protein A2126_02760 [Candidatus Woykebacteria bacterium GWB1_45_5]|uniref:CYTH domain-containing protein n=2 Tax=Candidatus Woykeibacteriota TaxID=1817899 RepID=A0A1G1VZX8_9BACT|nr:MAG: hypothetical protein A2113_01400 [Candidatus Woykebacteria bacterium GWA1_44_8]OGY24740.1 MAG: hypothetical protein A2126_02760 [Candidatus Woykebacteria bacterium GWB1_45_5]